MIASHLILSASIRRPQVNAFETRLIRRDAKRDSNKPARSFSRAWPRLTCQINFDNAVLEVSLRQNYKPAFITQLGRRSITYAQSLSTFEGNSLSFYIHWL